MFAMLDAEYALIIYDGDKGEYIAARDPIGIRPLYYGYDGEGVILFASEAKNLVGLTKKIMPFPPGLSTISYLMCKTIMNYTMPNGKRKGRKIAPPSV